MATDLPDEFVDGCGGTAGHGIMGDEPALPDDEADLFVLFAEALDPDTPKTVDEAETEWRELFR